MLGRRYEVLPWGIIITTVIIVLLFLLLSWLGWDRWSEL
jgi:hypothetical protein